VVSEVVICLGLIHGDYCFMYSVSQCLLLVAIGMRRLPKAHRVFVTAVRSHPMAHEKLSA